MTGPDSGTTATTPGNLNPSSGVWTGSMENGQCLNVVAFGAVTGSVGQDVTATFSIASSTLAGDLVNIDPELGNNTNTFGPSEIGALPDFALSTRLLTAGPITSGTPVKYETTISNVGLGISPGGNSLALAFIMPTGVTFDSVTDDDVRDQVSISPVPGCFDFGPSLNAGTGLAGYGNVAVCILEVSSDILPGESFQLTFNMTSGLDFAAGNVSVYGFISGDDADSLRNQIGLLQGLDTFDVYPNMNNLVRLQYDPNELVVTANRCPGQGATTTNGTGCFRISFSKLIVPGSFESSDLQLKTYTGSALDPSNNVQITGFTQLDDYTWEINVSGIPQGKTFEIGLDPASVQDLSAVENGVQVLGETTIRFEVAGASGTTSANGTLANTGVDSLEWMTALSLLIFGFVLVRVSQRKQIKSVRHFYL